MSLSVCLQGIGVALPGFSGWGELREWLLAPSTRPDSAEAAYSPQLLPANERRRASPTVRRAFQACDDLRLHSGLALDGRVSVFASSDADMRIIDRICRALTTPERMVSPTDFHNSVHNAASGYWSIAVAQRGAANAVGAYDGSAAAGLLEAATQVAVEQADALLVAYDVPAPEPLLHARPLQSAAGIALALSAVPGAQRMAQLKLRLSPEPETPCADPLLDALRRANPALRLLPLLQACARQQAARFCLPYTLHTQLEVEVCP